MTNNFRDNFDSIPRKTSAFTCAYVVLLAASILVFGCKKEKSLDENIDKLGRATGPVEKQMIPQPAMTATSGPRPSKTHTGKVLETIDVPNYTYIKLGTAKEELWAAVPTTKIETGTEIKILESLVMKDFESPTLKRKFETVVFGIIETETTEESMPAGEETPETNKPTPTPGELPPGHPTIN